VKTSAFHRFLIASSSVLAIVYGPIALLGIVLSYNNRPALALILFVLGSILIYRGLVVVYTLNKRPDMVETLKRENRKALAWMISGPSYYPYWRQIIDSLVGGTALIVFSIYLR
jgi:hypothetical protein